MTANLCFSRETLRKEIYIVNKTRNPDEEARILAKFAEQEAKKEKSHLYDIGRSKVCTIYIKLVRTYLCVGLYKNSK